MPSIPIKKTNEAVISILYNTPLDVALLAGLICTDSDNKIEQYDATSFISKLISDGHESVLEHINYSFKIENVSRALLQEMARHRHISLSVQSTRWALRKFSKNASFHSTEKACEQLNDEQSVIIDSLNNKLQELSELLVIATDNKIPNDIVKYYVTEAINTKFILTLNARELRLIFALRTSNRALKEFQDLCHSIYEQIPKEHKFMFSMFF